MEHDERHIALSTNKREILHRPRKHRVRKKPQMEDNTHTREPERFCRFNSSPGMSHTAPVVVQNPSTHGGEMTALHAAHAPVVRSVKQKPVNPKG